MSEQNRVLEAASEKRKRGRPAIQIGATAYLDGTRHTQINAKYMFEAINLISEAASEIPDSDLLWHSDDRTQRASGKHGILEQLGRMWLQDNYEYKQFVTVANHAINALKAGCTSRQIEKAIHKIRTTIKAAEKNPDDKWLYSRAAKAVQELQDMGENHRYRWQYTNF